MSIVPCSILIVYIACYHFSSILHKWFPHAFNSNIILANYVRSLKLKLSFLLNEMLFFVIVVVVVVCL